MKQQKLATTQLYFSKKVKQNMEIKRLEDKMSTIKNSPPRSPYRRSGVKKIYIGIYLTSCANILTSCGSHSIEQASYMLSAATRASDEERVSSITKGFDVTMTECPERIWPDYNWSQKKIYLTNKKTLKAFEWFGSKPQNNRVSSIEFTSLGPEFSQGLYGFDPRQSDAMSLSLDQSQEYLRRDNEPSKPDFLLSLGIHEGFHFFAQPSWKRPDSAANNDSRSVDYPILTEPRYLRGRLLKLLKSYLKNPSTKVLQEARGIYDDYEQKYPNEATGIASTDQREGSAFYAELVGTALSQLGCAIDEKTLISKSLEQLQASPAISGTSDSESYALGAAAGLIMRSSRAYAGWEKRIMGGQTPLSILFEGISPQSGPDDITLKQQAEDIVKQENQRFSTGVSKFIASMKDPEAITIHLKSSNLLGSYNTQGFIRHRDTGKFLTVDFAGSFGRGSSDSPILKVTDLTLEDSDHPTVCGNSGWVAHIPRKFVKMGQSTANIESQHITGKDIPVSTKKDSTGRLWICTF